MNPSSQIKSGDLAIQLRHHIAFMSALAGVGLLICWLSGGFPPGVWRTLFEVMSHIQALWSTRGTGLLVPLLILVVQSCLIGIAWGILLWFFWREYTVVRAAYTGKLVATTQGVTKPASHHPSSGSSSNDVHHHPHVGSNPALVVSSLAGSSRSSVPQPSANPLPMHTYAQQRVPAELFASPNQSSPSRSEILLDNPFEGSAVANDNERNLFEEADPHNLSNPFEDLSASSSTRNKLSPQAKKSPYSASSFPEKHELPEENEPVTEQWHSQHAPLEKKQGSQNVDQPSTEESAEEEPSSSISDQTSATSDNPFHEIDDMPEFYRQVNVSQHLSYGLKPMETQGAIENINPFGGNIVQTFPSTDPQREAISLQQKDTSTDIHRRSTISMTDESIIQQATEKTLTELPIEKQLTHHLSSDVAVVDGTSVVWQAPALATAGGMLERTMDSTPSAYPQWVGAVTHPGIDRAQKPNEDTHLIIIKKVTPAYTPLSAGLFLVADGMGGHNDGRFASTFVADSIRDAALLDDVHKDKEELKACFVEAIKHANKQLYDKNTQSGAFRGTTVSGALLVELAEEGNNATHVAYVANVGDSRTYHFSASTGFYRVTCDHSTVEALVEMGEITPEERYTDRRRNQIDRCLGYEPDVEVDVFTLLLRPMERLLLCSDGLWEMVRDERLALLLSVPVNEPSQIADLMLQAALEGGGHDNITAIVVQIP